MKEEPGQALLTYSSVGLMRTLAQHDLVDEYRLWVHPLVLGSGQRLFEQGGTKTELRLADTTTLPNGVVVLVYQPAH